MRENSQSTILFYGTVVDGSKDNAAFGVLESQELKFVFESTLKI